MAKKDVITFTVAKVNLSEMEAMKTALNRHGADICRQAIKEFAHRNGFKWTNATKPHRRKNKYAESLAQYGRNEGFTRERARQIVNEEEGKGDS